MQQKIDLIKIMVLLGVGIFLIHGKKEAQQNVSFENEKKIKPKHKKKMPRELL